MHSSTLLFIFFIAELASQVSNCLILSVTQPNFQSVSEDFIKDFGASLAKSIFVSA